MTKLVVSVMTALFFTACVKVTYFPQPSKTYDQLIESATEFIYANIDKLEKKLDDQVYANYECEPNQGSIEGKDISYPVRITFALTYSDKMIFHARKKRSNSGDKTKEYDQKHVLYVKVIKQDAESPFMITNQVYRTIDGDLGKYSHFFTEASIFLKNNKKELAVVYQDGESVRSYCDFPDEKYIDMTQDVKYPITFNATLNGSHVITMTKKERTSEFMILKEELINKNLTNRWCGPLRGRTPQALGK